MENLLIKLFYVPLILSVFGEKSQQPARPRLHIVLYKAELDFDPEKINGNASIQNNRSVNVYIEVLSKIDDLVIIVDWSPLRYGKYITLYHKTYDFCNILTNTMKDPMVKYFFDEFSETSTWKFSCPVYPGAYETKNFTLSSKRLPPFLPEAMFRFIYEIKERKNQKYLEKLVRMVIHGEIKHS